MIQPKPCGSFLELDDNGHVIKKASHNLIQTEWKPLVDKVIAIYKSSFGDNLHSIWLRGSVAKGQAEKGAADLDSFSYLVEEAESPVEFESAIEALESRHPYCFCIEADANPVSDIEYRHDDVMARIIKTQAICLHGEDLSNRIPPYALRDMVHYSRYLRFNLEGKLTAIQRRSGLPAPGRRGFCSDPCTRRSCLKRGDGPTIFGPATKDSRPDT